MLELQKAIYLSNFYHGSRIYKYLGMCKENSWIRIIFELFNIKKQITIFTDNLSSKTTIENGELNSKLKHINIKFYFNKDNLKNKRIAFE